MLNLIKESPINHRLPKNILHRMIDFGPIANFEWIWPANLSIFANGRVGQDKGWILVAQWTKLFAVELGCWVLQNCRLQRKKRDPCSKCNVCHSIWTQGGVGGSCEELRGERGVPGTGCLAALETNPPAQLRLWRLASNRPGNWEIPRWYRLNRIPPFLMGDTTNMMKFWSLTTLYEVILPNLENTSLSFSSPRSSPKFLMYTLVNFLQADVV